MGRIFPIANWGAAPSSLLTGLVSYWKLDEASGSRLDSVGGNTLTDNNTVTQNPGKVGSAAQCTKANSEYLSIADNAGMSTGDIDFTFAGWMFMDSIYAGGNDVLGKFVTAGNIEYFIEVYASGGTHFRFGVSSSGTGLTGDLDVVEASLTTATWHHFVCWHNSVANTINFQLNNGALRSISYSAGVRDGTSPFEIGRGVANRFWDGRIDEIGFWKRVLTAGERTALYNGGAGVTYPF